jgi:acetate kinase
MSVLVLNAGSSSLKFAVFDGGPERAGASGLIDRVGLPGGRFKAEGAERAVEVPDFEAAAGLLLEWLEARGPLEAAGHRVVHGGPRHDRPERITPALLDELRGLVPLAPNHLPGAIAAIEALTRRRPGLPQVACFDTAFHRSLDATARRLPLPRSLGADLQRYGFHGLSYEGVVHDLGADARGRLVAAHLGNGCSLAALRDGRAADTTMGLTPLGGLVMGTRPGDLDPGVPLHLLRGGMSPAELEEALSRKSGLLGVSETSPDMRDLLAAEAADPRAAEAVELFCRQARKHVAAMAASLGGIDGLVFTGGIGENAAPIRARIVGGLGFLGLRIDADRNARSAPLISPDGAPPVRVVRASEERVIARHVYWRLKA